MLSYASYSRLLGGPYQSFDEASLLELAWRMQDIPENRRKRKRGGTTPPSAYVYLGQFIDHDITRDPTPFDAAATPPDERNNVRTSWMDLDTLYPDSDPSVSPWFCHSHSEAEKFLIGLTDSSVAPGAAAAPPPTSDDIYRIDEDLAVNDDRNAENIIISQLHVLFQKFHNRMVDYLLEGRIPHPERYGCTAFEQARRLLTWHYHWIVRHDFLPTILKPEVWLDLEKGGSRVFHTVVGEEPLLPVEFTLAAYRFGHSTVQNVYDLSDHCAGVPLREIINPPGRPVPPLKSKAVIDWNYFTGAYGNSNVAENIDTLIAGDMFETDRRRSSFFSELGLPKGIPLPATTLIRGSRIGLPSGQVACDKLNIARLAADQIGFDLTESTYLEERGFLERTPLWYYILREAEVTGKKNEASLFGGECLGHLGSLIVGDVILGILDSDPDDYVNITPDWTPPALCSQANQSAKPVDSLARFINFAKSYHDGS